MMRCVTPIVPFPTQSTIATMQQDHAIQLLLCGELERVADRLPAAPGIAELRRIADGIQQVTDLHFPRAEQVLQTMPAGQRPTPHALDALHHMHVLDQLHGQDLVTALRNYVGAPTATDVGQLAYMLRCFFDGCRRAIRLKESYITFALRNSVKPD